MFEPSNILQKYINARPRDMYDVTGALMGYINADPAFGTNDFEEAIKYVLGHGISETELYKDFDSNYDFEEDESKWDNEYYSYARVYLKDNFCRKRIEHVKKVAGKLYPMTATGMSDSKPVPKREETEFEKKQTVQRRGGQQESGKKFRSQSGKSIIIKGLIVAAIIALLLIIGVGLAL